MSKLIDDLRVWLKNQDNYRQVSKDTGYNYHSLLKFIDGRVTDPQFSKVQLLIDYREKTEGTGTAA